MQLQPTFCKINPETRSALSAALFILGVNRKSQRTRQNEEESNKEKRVTPQEDQRKRVRLCARRALHSKEDMSNSLPTPSKMENQKLRAEIRPQVSKSSAQRLSRDLTCSICLDLFKCPVSLPCDHTFCEACITSYWSGPRSKGTGGFGSCPQCRKVFPRQSYRPNRIVANIVESYCQGIEESEGRLASGRVTVETVPPNPLCGRHREELKLFCEEDQELVCLVCGISQDHRSHTLVCVEDAEKRYRVRIKHRKQLLQLSKCLHTREFEGKDHCCCVEQVSLSNGASALQVELNTALECERVTESEVKKLKVRWYKHVRQMLLHVS